MKKFAIVTIAALAGAAMADTTVDISGVASVDGLGFGGNDTVVISTGIPGVEITSIEWDLFYSPISPSWTDEPHMTFNGAHDWDMGDHGGTSDSTPIALAGSEATSFFADGSGDVTIEFWEEFNDFGSAPDGFYDRGTITLKFVPAPASVALLGLGGLVATRRRR